MNVMLASVGAAIKFFVELVARLKMRRRMEGRCEEYASEDRSYPIYQ